MDSDRVAEVRAVREARARGDTWKWAGAALCAQQFYDMSVSTFYYTLPHYLDFIALHTSFRMLGTLSELVSQVWKAHFITGEDYRQFCEYVPQRPIVSLSQSQFPDVFDDQEQLVMVPCLAISDLDLSLERGIARQALLHAAQRFILAFTLCYSTNPLPEVWERIMLPRITDEVELITVHK